MPLPSLAKITPNFEVVIPSTEQPAKFRSFLVKEEQILLQAQESKDEATVIDAISQIVTQCAMSPLDVDGLAGFDIEYLFLKLRSRSVGEIVDLHYRCQQNVDLTPEQVKARKIRSINGSDPVRGKCDTPVVIQLNLNDVQVVRNPAHTRKIFFTESLGVTMRYPDLKMAKAEAKKSKGANNSARTLETIAACVESIWDESTVYSNFTIPEMVQWIQDLPQGQFTKIQQFFETMPTLAHDVPFHCPSCGYNSTIHLRGLESFFR